jgi:hypothetical protein
LTRHAPSSDLVPLLEPDFGSESTALNLIKTRWAVVRYITGRLEELKRIGRPVQPVRTKGVNPSYESC